MNDFRKIRDNSLRLIAKNQKLKLDLKKCEEIIVKYVESTEKLLDEKENLECELHILKDEFEHYKKNVKDNYRQLTPKEMGWE